MKTPSKFAEAAWVLRAATNAPDGMFDTTAETAILLTDDARSVWVQATEWAEMFDADSPFRADLEDIAILAGRLA